MADNYLEKKYEELRQGRPVIRRQNPSLDSLLSSAAAEDLSPEPGYRVDRAQSEAALASARRLGVEFDATMPDGDPAVLRITCAGAFELGEVVTAMRLKLAELRLHARIRLLDGGTGAELRIFRGKR